MCWFCLFCVPAQLVFWLPESHFAILWLDFSVNCWLFLLNVAELYRKIVMCESTASLEYHICASIQVVAYIQSAFMFLYIFIRRAAHKSQTEPKLQETVNIGSS